MTKLQAKRTVTKTGPLASRVDQCASELGWRGGLVRKLAKKKCQAQRCGIVRRYFYVITALVSVVGGALSELADAVPNLPRRTAEIQRD